MSWILGIDSSSIDLGLGLYHDNAPIASLSRYVRHSHAEHIVPAINALLEMGGVTPQQIDHIAIAAGPGSFTGLRIGIAFVKGFCREQSVRVLPLSSLHCAAFAWRTVNGRVHTVIDGRNGEIFWGSFEIDHGRVVRLTGDQFGNFEKFRDSISPGDMIITDTMGYSRSTVFNFLDGRPGVFPVEQFPIQRGLSCAALGAENINEHSLWRGADEIFPNYLRATAAQTRAGA